MAFVDKARLQFVMVDNSSTTASFSMPIAATTDTDGLAAFKTALEGVLDGVVREYGAVVTQYDDAVLFSADRNSDTRFLWRCQYTDTTTLKQYVVSIPTADTEVRVNGREYADLTTGAGAAFKTAFEAVCKSPDGNAVRLDAMDFVTR